MLGNFYKIKIVIVLLLAISGSNAQESRQFGCPLTTPIKVKLSSLSIDNKGMVSFGTTQQKELLTQEEKNRFFSLLNIIPNWCKSPRTKTEFELGISDLSLRYLMENVEILSDYKQFEKKVYSIESPYHLAMLVQDLDSLELNKAAELVAKVLAEKITGGTNHNLFVFKGDLDFGEVYAFFESLNKHAGELTVINNYLRSALAAMYQNAFGRISNRIFSFKTNNSISSLTIDVKKKQLAASNGAQELQLWQLDDGMLVQKRNMKPAHLNSLVFNSTGDRILGVYDTTIYEFSIPELKPEKAIQEDQSLNAIAYSPNKPLLAIAGNKDGKIFNLNTNKKSYIPKLENKAVFSIGYNQSGDTLIAAGSSAILLYKSSASGEEIKLSPNMFEYNPVHTFVFGRRNEMELFVGTHAGKIIRVNLQTKQPREVADLKSPVRKIVIDEKRNMLISGDVTGSVKMWNITEGRLQLKKHFPFNGAITGLLFISGNDYLVIGTEKDGIRIIDMRAQMGQFSLLEMLYFIYIARKVEQKTNVIDLGQDAVSFYQKNVPPFIRENLKLNLLALPISSPKEEKAETAVQSNIQSSQMSYYQRIVNWFTLSRKQKPTERRISPQQSKEMKEYIEKELKELD